MNPTQICLDRIARFDSDLRAFTALDRDRALADAAQSEVRIAAGDARPLEGWPIAIKANIDIAGLATTAGVEARRHAVAAADAPAVAALRAAGAVILGHANMHEAALGATTDNPAYGQTVNPHRRNHTAGGSSGGSAAAVAAAMCRAALGTDTLGSIRIPAAYTGIYGLKPTNGLVSTVGVVALAARLDCVGPMARNLDDLHAVMEALAPLGPGRPTRRIATLAGVDAYGETETAVRDGFDRAVDTLRRLGYDLTQHATPNLDLAGARMGGFIESAREAARTFAADRASGGISPGFAAMLDFGAGVAADSLAHGEAAMAAARDTLLGVLENADAILMPTTPQAAFPHGHAPATQADFTALANLAGLPAITLPSGTGRLPVGVQIVGRAGDEASLIALARRLDAELAAYRPPPVFA